MGCRHGNVLVGAALHGADRLRVGEVPTELEGLLLDVLRGVLAEEEIGDWGRVYREAVAARGHRLGVVPVELAELPVTSGYGLAELRACAREVAEEAVVCANVSFLSTEALAEGEPLWSEEFVAGVRGAGFGVVGFAGVSHGGGAEGGSFRATWELVDFHAGHDPSSTLLFDAPASTHVSFTTHSRTEQNTDLIRALDDLTRACDAAVADLAPGDLAPGQVHVGIAWAVMKLFVLLRAICADDPPEIPLRFVFPRAATTVHHHRRDLALDLKNPAPRLRYTGERPPSPSGDLEYATYRADGGWSAPVPLGLPSVTAPSLASYRGDLHLVFARPGDHRLMWSRLRAGVWRTPVPVGRSGSRQRVALTVHEDLLYAFHTTPDGEVLWSRFDGSAWTREVRMDGWDSPVSPDIASHDGHLWIAHRDHGGRTHVDRLDKDHTSDFTHRFDDSASDSAPALVSTDTATDTAAGTALWIAHRGLDDKVHVSYSSAPTNPAAWQTHAPAHDLLTQRSPTLVAHPDLGPLLLARGADGRLRLGARTEAGGWGGIDAPAGEEGLPALDAGGAAYHGGKLYVIHRR
ncbi:hypothetical protein IAG44_35520 [Streptomyces roseirectus]|uniref:Uncharacterized protein n=1 Tax=Streptomyces roseirectus TaxID=2768066 RepID=A0A7H0IN78_9ACTN|nr:hypothetical protein [Streptomyces roseirectus]QNP74244.1 hypothetical protein IAG44_35520 [Streptomyces roseirectus]